MDLNTFLNDVTGQSVNEENTNHDETNKESEKFIKNLKKVRFNMMFKNIDRISAFMFDQGATVRGIVKKTILSGAMDLFKQSRKRSVDYRKSKNDMINKNVDKYFDKLKLEGSIKSFDDEVEFERLAFEKILEQVTEQTMSGVTRNDKLTFFVTQFLKTDMLESSEERKYHDRAIEIVEYFVIQTMQIRIVFSIIQTIIARIVSKVKLSKVNEADKKAKIVGDILVKFFKVYVESKFGLTVGKYFSTYVEDYYHSTKDKKEQFTKFENIINVMLGIKKV